MKNDRKKEKIIACIFLVLAVMLTVIGFLILPDTLVIQMAMDGSAGNTAPKALGLLLPLGLSGFGAVCYGKSGSGRMLLIAGVGMLSFLLLFAFNI